MRELSELEGELSAGEWQPREKRQGHPGAGWRNGGVQRAGAGQK